MISIDTAMWFFVEKVYYSKFILKLNHGRTRIITDALKKYISSPHRGSDMAS